MHRRLCVGLNIPTVQATVRGFVGTVQTILCGFEYTDCRPLCVDLNLLTVCAWGVI